MTGSPTRVEGSARLEFVLDGKKCNMKFLDADVKRLLASVSAVVERGKYHRVRTARVSCREHEHWQEDASEQEEGRVCGASSTHKRVRELQKR